jgi:hypothetical protein
MPPPKEKMNAMSRRLQQTFERLENPGVIVHDRNGVSDNNGH